MKRNEKPSNSKAKEENAPKKETYSPTKYYTDMAQRETEKILKIAEAETRLEFYKNFKAAREQIVRDDPDVNQTHIRRLEEYQINETAKRREEVRAIEQEMREINEHAKKTWSQK